MSTNRIRHYGIKRRSGRYPWGSGKDPQSGGGILQSIDKLKAKGMRDETDIAKALGISTTELRSLKTVELSKRTAERQSTALRLKERGVSNIAIAKRLNVSEATVRNLLKPGTTAKRQVVQNVTNAVQKAVDEKGLIDVGSGSEFQLGVSRTKLNAAVSSLKAQGYTVHYIQVQQAGTGKPTNIKVLAPPNTGYADVYKRRSEIKMIDDYTVDGGHSFLSNSPTKVRQVSPSRVDVRYDHDGGSEMDGIIELRRGVEDLSLGNSRYAQVRVAVGKNKYLKGVAVYSDDLPPGVDIRYNTSKKKTANKLDAMKDQIPDEVNPFGSSVRPKFYTDSTGKRRQSSLNVVYEEGEWGDWSRTLSSQFLSKQSPSLAKKQLGLSLERQQADFEEIMSIKNPTVRKHLLSSFAETCDSGSVNLKAASLPRQGTHVLIPDNKLKTSEVYAPNYRNGEKVVLIRHPHGGTFEIPELTVNNKAPTSKRLLGNAKDAIAINSKVAAQLSGADFDGDTVLVIPNNGKQVRSSKAIKSLQSFDPRASYPEYKGMTRMSSRGTQLHMGNISNLITDMSIRGATVPELTRAVKHSMVVIDSEKHGLNYKQSYDDHGISALKKKYQGRAGSGAATLISRASSRKEVYERKTWSEKDIDPVTGRKVFKRTGSEYVNRSGKRVVRTQRSTKMAEVSDASALSSGTVIEGIYADYANKMKGLGNLARKRFLSTPNLVYSAAAKKRHTPQVKSLKAKLRLATSMNRAGKGFTET